MQPKTPTVELTIEERDQRMVTMKLNGWTYPMIAEELGLALSTCHEAVEKAMKAVPFPDADALRQIELADMDKARYKALKILDDQHVTVSASGKVVYDNGQPVLDDSIALKAIDTLLRLQTRRAKLLGLDAPTRSVALIGIVTLDEMKSDIEAQFERLREPESVIQSA